MEAIAHSFPRFKELPPELRLAIWRECLPWRVYEVDEPHARSIFDAYPSLESPDEVPCTLACTSYMNARPPVITRVCQESRKFAFKQGALVVEDSSLVLEAARWSANNLIRGPVWRDKQRDIVHLNWHSLYKSAFRMSGDSEGQPLRYLDFLLGNSTLSGSFTAAYLQPQVSWTGPAIWWGPSSLPVSYRTPDGDPLPFVEVLSHRPEWLLVMRSVVVHATLRDGAASGLFGLLGDAPVQIVDMADVAKMDAFYALAHACEDKGDVKYTQNFHRDDIRELELRIASVLKLSYECAEPTFRLRPAVMFHLCPLMCNHLGQEVKQQDLMNPGKRLHRQRITHWGRRTGRWARWQDSNRESTQFDYTTVLDEQYT